MKENGWAIYKEVEIGVTSFILRMILINGKFCVINFVLNVGVLVK